MSDGAVDTEIAAACRAEGNARRRGWTGRKLASLDAIRSGTAAPADAEPNGPTRDAFMSKRLCW